MGQEALLRLKASSAIIVGLNDAGLTCANYLVRAGIGKLGLLDDGGITKSDLASSNLFSLKDVGQRKAAFANQQFSSFGSGTEIITHLQKFDSHSTESVLARYNLVIDGLSDWQEKLLASDLCMHLGKPLVHHALLGMRVHAFTCIPGSSACLRCVLTKMGLEDLPHSTTSKTTFGPASGLAGSLQAAEAIKLICHLGLTHQNTLICFDILKSEFYNLHGLDPEHDCPDCGRPNLDS